MKMICFINILMILSSAGSALTPIPLPPILPPLKTNPNGPAPLPSRIVGGSQAEASDYPFIASLQTSGGFHFCGASVFRKASPAIIITAAHCTPTTAHRIVLNADFTGDIGPDVINSAITSVLIHPNYNSGTNANDIALIWIAEDISTNADVGEVTIVPVSPASDECCVPGEALQVIGYGADFSGGPPTPTLEFVDLNYVSQAQCSLAYSNIVDTMNCAAAPESDSCQGDSGGPMIKSGTNEQVGVVSFGRGCALEGYPGVYTELGAYYDWIMDPNSPIPGPTPPPPPPPLQVCNAFNPNYHTMVGDIACGQTVSGTISQAYGGNIYRLRVSGPQCEIAAYTCGANSPMDTAIDLREPNGNEINCNDDACGDYLGNVGWGLNSYINAQLPSNEYTEYYLKVEGWGLETGNYELTVECSGLCDVECVSDAGCANKPDGHYQNCEDCGSYVSCVSGIMYDNRPCAPSNPPLLWDDEKGYCDYESDTCNASP